MEHFPQRQATLAFGNFLTKLLDLQLFNTILVLYDETTSDQINLLIESFDHRFNVIWRLINDYQYDNPEYWDHIHVQDQNELILTALPAIFLFPLISPLYYKRGLNQFSRHIVVFSGNSKIAQKILSTFSRFQTNAIVVDWSRRDVLIYAWNPFADRQFVELNETEFLRASNVSFVNIGGKYTGMFFDQLQSMEGKSTRVVSVYDTKNVYNVVTKGSVASIDGTEIRLLDLICAAIQSPIDLLVLNTSTYDLGLDQNLLSEFWERSYRTYAHIKRRHFEKFTFNDLKW